MNYFLNYFYVHVQELANALIPAAVSQYMFQGQEGETYPTAGYEEQWSPDMTASTDPSWERAGTDQVTNLMSKSFV